MLFSELNKIASQPRAQTVDWRSLRQHAQRESDQRHSCLLTDAFAEDMSPTTYLKNLLLDSEPGAYDELLGLALVWYRQGKVIHPIDEFQELGEYLEKIRTPFVCDIGLWLLGVQEPPDPYKFTLPFWCNLGFIATLDYEHRKARTGKKRGNQSDTARFLEQYWEALEDSGECEFQTAVIRSLVGYNLVPLGFRQLQKLPSGLLTVLLEDRTSHFSAASALFTSQALSKIEQDPLRLPETPESIADTETPEAIADERWIDSELPVALQAIKERMFQKEQIAELLCRPDFHDYEDRIRGAFRERLSGRKAETLEHRRRHNFEPFELASSLPAEISPDIRHAFLFFQGPPCRENALDDLLNQDEEVWEATADLLAPYEWDAALRACHCPETLRRGLAVLRNSPDEECTIRWIEMLQNQCTWETRSALLDEILDARWPAKEWARWKRFWSPNHLPLNAKAERLLQDSSFLRFLVESTRRKGFASRFFPALPLSLQRDLLDSPSENAQRIRNAWVKHAQDQANESLSKYLRFLLSQPLSRLSKESLPRVTRDEYSRVLRTFQKTPVREIFEHIFALRLTTGERAWESFFKVPYPRRLLRRLAERHDPRVLQPLERRISRRRPTPADPQAAIRAVLDREAHPGSAPHLQNRLREFIPWARERYADRPTRAVAAELALATTLWEASYLLYLCTYRWKAGPRGKEGRVFDEFYSAYRLPKRSGGFRTITAPDTALKRLQRAILHFVLEPEPVHPAAHGFVRDRSIRTNAEIHCGQELVVNCDIRSFFPSTPHHLIRRAFANLEHLQLAPAAVSVLADLCSYRGGLPTGAPTSPALANLILRPIDEALTKAAEAKGFAYSRYADDLTFSGGSDVASILPFVRRVLRDFGYKLDPKKTNLFRRGRRQIATGLVVNEKPNLPRRQRRRLRAAAHRRSHGKSVHWHGRPMSDEELQGRLAHLHVVQPEEARRYLQLWQPIAEAAGSS